MASLVVNLVVELLLRLVPGIGPIAPALAAVALKLGEAEAGVAYGAVKALVAAAAADRSLASGSARFEWVLPRALAAVAEAQPNLALSLVRTMIETAVQELD